MVNAVVNGRGCYMTIPDLSLAFFWVYQKIFQQLDVANERGDSYFDIDIRFEVEEGVRKYTVRINGGIQLNGTNTVVLNAYSP